MLTFLRKIRKSMIESLPASEGTAKQAGGSTRKPASPFGRYLIYAIGEILLVMIGILLALQVNNWNDDRKDRKTEVRILENLAKSLDLNINQFDHKLARIHSCNRSGDLIYSVLNNKNNNPDTLSSHWHAALLNHGNLMLSNAGYESLRNLGFDIIGNESLQEEIINLYENTYLNMGRRQVWGNTIRPDWDKFIREHFISVPFKYGGLKPRDFDFVVKSNYFNGLIDVASAQRSFYMDHYEESLEETKRLLQLISDELGKEE